MFLLLPKGLGCGMTFSRHNVDTMLGPPPVIYYPRLYSHAIMLAAYHAQAERQLSYLRLTPDVGAPLVEATSGGCKFIWSNFKIQLTDS